MNKYYLVYCSDTMGDLVMTIECLENKLVFNYGEKYTKEKAEKYLCGTFRSKSPFPKHPVVFRHFSESLKALDQLEKDIGINK